MIKVFTNDFRCDMMKKATGLQKGSRCLFLIFYTFIRKNMPLYNKVKIGVRKWNFDHALTFIMGR